MLNFFWLENSNNCDLYRPRELKLKEKEAISLILCHVTVESKTGTSKRRDVPQLDIHLERSEDVSDNRVLFVLKFDIAFL